MNQTTELVQNLPAAERVKRGTVVNTCGINAEAEAEANLLQPVIINGVELQPRILQTPRLVYASAAEWNVYDDAKHTLADYAVYLNINDRLTAETCIRALESRGVMLRTRDSKARISNLMAYDLCEGTANRAEAEGNIVNRAHTHASNDNVNLVTKFEKPLADIAKARHDAARAAKIAEFVANAVKMGIPADKAREFAEAQVK